MAVTTKLPIAVSASILIVSLVASAISITLLRNYVNDSLEQKATIFLDSFAEQIAKVDPLDL